MTGPILTIKVKQKVARANPQSNSEIKAKVILHVSLYHKDLKMQ